MVLAGIIACSADDTKIPMVEAHLVKPHDISSQDGAALEQVCPDTLCYQGLLSCLELARQVAEVRSDTRVLILRDAAGFAGYWSFHARPDG